MQLKYMFEMKHMVFPKGKWIWVLKKMEMTKTFARLYSPLFSWT